LSQDAPTVTSDFVSGFVTIIGRPNAGKSTLLNALAGGKVAIVSSKPQTTRTSVQAVVSSPHSQIVFIDTPGIHEAPSLLNRRMMETVRAALQERDLLLFVADCLTPVTEDDGRAAELIHGLPCPVLLVLNKIDRLDDKRQLLPRIEQYQSLYQFAECLPVSASKGAGLDRLRESIVARLPAGPQYFPADYITDQPERFMAAELIREKILRETRQEVPHSIAVITDKWEDTPRIVRIAATIYVERPGQKAIVIGAKGAVLKTIGTSARIEIEKLLGRKVFLELFVKVRPNWRESPEFVNAIDWRSTSGTELESDLEKD
jgi:GTP-binding protein Era